MRGEKVKGSFALVRTKEAKSWLLIKHKDRFVTSDDVTAQDRSVLAGVSVEDMKVMPAHRIPASQLVPAGEIVPVPEQLEPMHAESGAAPFNAPDWMWEPKLDGYRVLAFIGDKEVKLRSRRGLELAPSFPRLVEELRKQAVSGMVLDGEIVALDAAGKPSFNALQNRVQLKARARAGRARIRSAPVVFYCFDLLYFAGIDLRQSPYRDRRRYLSQCLLPSPLVRLVHASEDGVALHAAAMASGLEGVIGKRKDSRYESGKRSALWLKIKPTLTDDFVVGGYTRGKGSRASLGALLVGYWGTGESAGSSSMPRTSDPASTTARSTQRHASAEAAREKDLPVRRKAGAAQSHHLGGTAARGRGQVPELDRGRQPSRAGIPAAARRRGREGRETGPQRRAARRHPRGGGVPEGGGVAGTRVRHRRDRRNPGATGESRNRIFAARGGARTASA